MPSYKQRIRAYEIKIIIEALIENKWCVANAAKSLKIERTTLFMKLRAFGIVRPHSRYNRKEDMEAESDSDLTGT